MIDPDSINNPYYRPSALRLAKLQREKELAMMPALPVQPQAETPKAPKVKKGLIDSICDSKWIYVCVPTGFIAIQLIFTFMTSENHFPFPVECIRWTLDGLLAIIVVPLYLASWLDWFIRIIWALISIFIPPTQREKEQYEYYREMKRREKFKRLGLDPDKK